MSPLESSRPVQSMSLAEVENEIERNAERLAVLKDARSRAYLQSSTGANEVKEMGNRRKALADKKSWTGRLGRAESKEIKALQEQIRTRGQATDAAIAEMRAISDETRELTKRQEVLDKRRTDLRARGR
ncbi:MAG TPA: hypothetical protein VHA57_06010 [Actinomycetota bacterium]|nr:hypothetical protein [Actinomycetota bacterium]